MKKKKYPKYPEILLFLISISFLLTLSCSDKIDENGEDPLPPPVTTLPPSITLLSPESGSSESEVIIVGKNFGGSNSERKVSFGSKDAKIISYTKTQIKVVAPYEAKNIKVNVSVAVDDESSNTLEYEYKNLPPVIRTMTETCFYNSTVLIAGSNFSPNKEDNIVKFGTIEGTVTRATGDSLYVITPNLGEATTADVTVTRIDMTSDAKSIKVDADQNKIATYDWTTHTVKPGVIYKTAQLSLFGPTQRRIYILDVTLNESNTLGIGFSTNNATPVAMCRSYDAVAGINAGYFPMGGSVDKDPYVRIDGVTVQEGHTKNVSYYFTNATFRIHKNVAAVKENGPSSDRAQNLRAAAIPVSTAENVIVCGPHILESNEIPSTLDMTKSHNSSKTARTGIGVTADGKRVFMVVVDTGGTVTGLSALELAKILQALGAVDAMGFDGGGSSTMYVDDQGDNGRVNFPYGGTTQRAVRSVIYVK